MFNVGFELELVGPSGINSRKDLHNHLVRLIREPWAKTLVIDSDYSVEDERPAGTTRKDPRKCVEVITQPVPIKDGLHQLETLLTWAQAECITNHSTGLHVNLSFIDARKTKKVNFEKMISLIPQEEILRMFDRDANEYCEPLSLSSIDVSDIYYLVDSDDNDFISILSALCKSANGRKPSNTKLKNFVEPYRKLSNAQLGALVKKVFDDNINDILIAHVNDNDKGVFVVDRTSHFKGTNQQRYFEFRGHGNADYQYRTEEILWCIDTYCQAMKEAVV